SRRLRPAACRGSLFDQGPDVNSLSRLSVVWSFLGWERVGSLLFRRSLAQCVRLELSRLLNSPKRRQAARELEELAGTAGAAEAAGLKGSLRASTCQQAISTLRATAALAALPFPCRRRTST